MCEPIQFLNNYLKYYLNFIKFLFNNDQFQFDDILKLFFILHQLRAEKTIQSGDKKKRRIGQFWKALGIDPNTTPKNLTLGEIGLESMFAVELQQEMERELNIKIGLNHIKSVEVGMLKDYEEGKMATIEKYLGELKTSREALIKFKFIIPTETHTLLNSGKKGKPIYFLPPLEITYSGMEGLVSKFDRPVIGLNWTKNMKDMKTMKEITSHFEEIRAKRQIRFGRVFGRSARYFQTTSQRTGQ